MDEVMSAEPGMISPPLSPKSKGNIQEEFDIFRLTSREIASLQNIESHGFINPMSTRELI
jgi:hypothetical protein